MNGEREEPRPGRPEDRLSYLTLDGLATPEIESLVRRHRDGWYFAIVGLEPGSSPFFRYGPEDEPLAELRPVLDPPGAVELVRMCGPRGLQSVALRYDGRVTYELWLNRGIAARPSDRALFDVAWSLISLLRISDPASFLVPFASRHSWNSISPFSGNERSFEILEDHPAGGLPAGGRLTGGQLEWALASLDTFARLVLVPKFRAGVDQLTTHGLGGSERASASMLWSGIDTVLESGNDRPFRSAAILASVIAPRGTARRHAFRSLSRLYAARDRDANGWPLSGEPLREHVASVEETLRRLLQWVISSGDVPTGRELEENIFD